MIKEELLKIIEEHKKTVTDICDAIYEFIYEKEEKKRFEYFLSFMDEINVLDIDIEDVSPEESDQLNNKEKHEEVIQLKNTILGNNIRSGKEKKEFYEELWNKINDTSLISDDEMRRLFLRYLWIDKRIPYYKLDEGCLMEDDEFVAHINEIRELLKQASFITSVRWTQKTERASHLMKLAEQIEDGRTRAVFWGVVIGFIEINKAAPKE